MAATYVAEPKAYVGKFKWGLLGLYDDIKASVSNYDIRDPRTWPLIKSLGVPIRSEEIYQQLPIGVAYSKECMDYVLRSDCWGRSVPPGRCTNIVNPAGKKTSMTSRFLYYPYNITREGKLRERVGIPKDQFEFWMEAFKGTTSIAKPRGVDETVTPVIASENEQHKNTPPTSSFERVMENLAERKAIASKTAALQEKLRKAEERYQQEKERADRAENSNTSLQESLDNAQKRREQEKERADNAMKSVTAHNITIGNMRVAQRRLEDQITHLRTNISNKSARANREAVRANEAEGKIRVLENTVKKHKIEAEAAKKEASEANEWIETIWRQMQEIEDNGKGKRKANDGACHGQQKKAKTDT